MSESKKGLFSFGRKKKEGKQDAGEEETPKQGFFARIAGRGKDADTPNEPVETPAAPPPAPPADNGGQGFFTKLKAGLRKTRSSIASGAADLFRGSRKIDEDTLEELEEMLIATDLGVETSMAVIDKVRGEVSRDKLKNGEELKKAIQSELFAILDAIPDKGLREDAKPLIILIVGVNGVGKTTTIGKIANLFAKRGKTVTVCAADTFRAAAVEQLQIWADRAGVDIVLKEGAKDPAAVVYDALERVKSSGSDVLLIDTAGRLHNNPNLMNELSKIHRIVGRAFEGAPHHTLLILDAVTGQNGLQQARQFVSKVGVTDLAITKLDGTAKGGIAIAVAKELNMPIQFVGVGEQMDDLLPFEKRAFVDSLFND